MKLKLILGSLLLLTVLAPMASAAPSDQRADLAGCTGTYVASVDGSTQDYTNYVLNEPVVINNLTAKSLQYGLVLVTHTNTYVNCIGFFPTQ